jgi:hypothetical protein
VCALGDGGDARRQYADDGREREPDHEDRSRAEHDPLPPRPVLVVALCGAWLDDERQPTLSVLAVHGVGGYPSRRAE